MLRVYVDTSSVLFGFKNKHNLFEIIKDEFYNPKIIISNGVISELKRLAESKKGIAPAAKIALEVLVKTDLEIDKNGDLPDKWLLKRSGASDIVCTNDAKLKQLLKKKGVRVLSLGKDGKLK